MFRNFLLACLFLIPAERVIATIIEVKFLGRDAKTQRGFHEYVNDPSGTDIKPDRVILEENGNKTWDLYVVFARESDRNRFLNLSKPKYTNHRTSIRFRKCDYTDIVQNYFYQNSVLAKGPHKVITHKNAVCHTWIPAEEKSKEFFEDVAWIYRLPHWLFPYLGINPDQNFDGRKRSEADQF